jgi:hypothetical protein
LIPAAYIQAWSAKASWPTSQQVEQDLVISRALCDLFNAPALKGRIAFRGGTAINKLLFKQALRYSEDIDLVQTQAEPIGTTVNAIRDALSWLGKCNRERMLEKLACSLTEDIAPLLPAGIRFDDDDAMVAFECIWAELIARIRGDAWKLTDKVVEDLRRGPYPRLLRGDELPGR